MKEMRRVSCRNIIPEVVAYRDNDGFVLVEERLIPRSWIYNG